MLVDSVALTLVDLEAHDPHAPTRDGERRFLCPLSACAAHTNPTRHRSLAVNTGTGAWQCWRCQARGKLGEWYEARPRRGRDRARVAAARAFALPRQPVAPSMSAAPWRDAWDKAGPLPDTLGARYLIGRGVPLTLAVAAGVRWATSWYGRPAVVFPIVDQAGELVAATGRHTDQGDPKAHAGGPKSQGLFTTPGALGASALVIVEAPIDALALAACGVPAVALCGTSGPTWLPAAAALRPVLLALDNDQAGDAAAATLARTLSSYGACCERLRPGPGKDWAEALATLGRAGLEARLAELHLTTTPSAPLLEDVAPDDFGDLRDLLERGQLRGYGRLGLEGGGVVLNLEGYVATRLEDLAWPALAQGAALQLRRVRAALASIDMLAAEYFRIVNKSSLTNEDNPYPTR